MANYTVSDLVGAFCAILLFIPFLLVPGYVLGWSSDCFGFRRLSVPWRLLISLPLSVALCPILSFLLGSTFSWAAVWTFYGLLLVAAIVLFAGVSGHEGPRSWILGLRGVPRVSYLIILAWLTIAVFSLVDMQLGPRLYYSVVAYDYSVRTAITDAITRTGARPANPFYFLTGPTPLRYHYFWFLACSLVDRLGGSLVDARRAVIGSAIWAGWALIAMVPLYLRFLFGWTGDALRRRSALAIAFFAITGLDLLPIVYLARKHIFYAHIEWWNEHEVTSWFGTALWVPHHSAALVSGLAGFLLIWDAASRQSTKGRVVGAIMAGIALATMVGTSIHVAVIFAIFLCLWTLLIMIRRDWGQLGVLVVAGLLTTCLSVPYLRGLAGPGFGGPFMRLAIRHLSPVDTWAYRVGFSTTKVLILRFVLLPVNYLLEFGFFLVVGVIYTWRLRNRGVLSLPRMAALLLLATSLFICTFFRSGVISNNDLGSRGMLPAQFVLLLWASELFAERGEQAQAQRASFHGWWLRSVLWMPLLLLGFAGTVYEIGILRFDGLLSDLGVVPLGLTPNRHLGRRTYSLREAYDEIRRKLPANLIIENNPETEYDFSYGLYADRQTAALGRNCGTEFGGDPIVCARVFPELASIFTGESNLSVSRVQEICRRAHIDALVLKNIDEAWHNPQSWVWRVQPVITTDCARVFLLSRMSQTDQPKINFRPQEVDR